MAKELIQETLKDITKVASNFMKLPSSKMWLDYDKEADVLYISFQKPQKADDSEMQKNGILLSYRKDKLVGVTILDFSKRNTLDEKRTNQRIN